MTGKSWNDAMREAAWTFLFIAAFPRLAHRLQWPTRLGPRGLLLYIAFNTALGMAARTWAVPLFKRLGDQREQAKDELRQQLGREPTDEELGAHLLARHQAAE
jgi:hypothetical protein